jgi:Crp-like helix-turn-helix domain
MAVSPGRKRVRRRADPTGLPVGNSILAALLAAEYQHLLPKLEHVTLKRGAVIYRADQNIEEVYFPEDAVIAMVDTTDDRRTVEVGIIGSEGIVGINIFLGGVVTPDKAIVQLAGGAFRMKSKDLRKAVRFGSPLQRLLLDYTRTFLAVISQSVACARELQMDQQSIAAMLGVRRVGVTEAASRLRAAGLIRYSRGHIHIQDKAGLGGKACECYRFIKQEYQSLHGALPRLLSGKSRA